MNTIDLEALLADLELAYNDRIPEAPAHFKPQAVGTIMEQVPILITKVRELIRAAKEERRDTFEAGRDHYFSDKSGEMEVYFTHKSFAEWERIVPPDIDEPIP